MLPTVNPIFSIQIHVVSIANNIFIVGNILKIAQFSQTKSNAISIKITIKCFFSLDILPILVFVLYFYGYMDFDQWQPFKKERKKLNENNITFNLTAPANETCQP